MTSARLLVELFGAKLPRTTEDDDDDDIPRLSDILCPNGLPAPIAPMDPDNPIPAETRLCSGIRSRAAPAPKPDF
ncbi:MAG: hypothetical protein ABR865_07410 [Terracidiphilus sp.]|jgi:hypothetical protein